MRAINESKLHLSLDSGSTKRLKSFRKRLAADKTKVVFDDKAVDIIKEFAKKPKQLQDELLYLDKLTDSNGVPFARSIKSYSDMKQTWQGFSNNEKGSFRWAQHCKAAERIVKERYSKARLRCLQYSSDQDIEDALTNLGTSTGWTSIVTGLQHKRDVLSDVHRVFNNKSQQALIDGSFNSPMLPGVRTQCSGEYTDEGLRTGTCKHKTRPIWMVDVYTVIAERMWAKPLTEWLKSYPYSAVGKDDHAIAKRVGGMRLEKRNYISIDYSKYDSSMPSWLIEAAFEIVEAAFIDQDSELLKVIKNDFIRKNLVTAEGVQYVNHGDPSGSGFTTIINGICNEIMTECWASFLGMTKDVQYMIMGDDNLIYFNGQVDKGIIASYLLHNFGVTVNETKTTTGTVGEDPEFLSRIWTVNGAYRHPNILISKIAFPEKFRDYKKISPLMVVYSYILAYPAGMRELIDVNRFFAFARKALENENIDEAYVKHLPYNVQLAYEANGGYLPGLKAPKTDLRSLVVSKAV